VYTPDILFPKVCDEKYTKMSPVPFMAYFTIEIFCDHGWSVWSLERLGYRKFLREVSPLSRYTIESNKISK